MKTTFRNHVYQWRGEVFVQREGLIGLELAGIVAKLQMIRWIKIFNNMLKQEIYFTYLVDI